MEVHQCSLHFIPFKKKKKNHVICSLALSGAEEGGVSTDEDAPYRDDLNDQSYDPKGER